MTPAGSTPASATPLSLRFQANRRLVLVSVIASALLLAMATLAYHFLNKRELAQRQALVQVYYANTLKRLEEQTRQSAIHLGSRLEFSRMLESSSDGRWPRLTSYLNAQWAYSTFTNLAILDKRRQPLYSYGSEAAALREHAVAGGDWLYVPRYHQLYRIYRVPLWLGEPGQGELVVFKALSNSMLRQLAIPQTRLELHYAGQNVASTLAGGATGAPPAGARTLRIALPWTPQALGDGPQPMLIVHRDISDLMPFSNFVLLPVALSVLVFITLIWLGLGRWLRLTATRIASLGYGALHYAEGHDRDSLSRVLQPAFCRDDEIRATASALENLVHTLELREQEQKSYLDTLAILEEAVIEFDGDCRIQRASPGWGTLTGQTDSIGHPLGDFIHAQDMETLQAQCLRLIDGTQTQATLRLRLAVPGDAAETWVEARLLAFGCAPGQNASIRGVLRDITQTYQHEQQITHMALHDALTQLPNRTLLEDRFRVALRLATRRQDKVGICFIDIDHFKVINDTLGHKAGDRLLVAFARRLAEQLRGGDTLARWGGDEFVLLLPGMDSESGIRQVTDKVVSALQLPLAVDGTDIRVTFSMGAAVFPVDGDNMETLFSHADQAMFHAKAQGRNQACFFQDMSRRQISRKQLYVQNRLATAIDRQAVETWFQPIVNATTGRVTAVEALARWHDAEQGWISPSLFIPMAENLGLINELGSHILTASLDAFAQFRARGLDILLAVNISKRQLAVSAFPEWLLAEVRQRGLHPGQIVLEVTESVALNDVERAAIRVQELRQAGFLIAIDDFGTGYSSLSQLHELQAIELKIDISFVRRLDDPAGLSMVQAIIGMANALGMKTVAEGVETPAVANTLRTLGVHCLQGYLYAHPMPQADIEAWLHDNLRTCVGTKASGQTCAHGG